MSLLGGLWLVLNWVLAVSFARKPFNKMDNIYYYLVSPIFVLPIPIFIMEDKPSGGRSWLYQIWLLCATWSFAVFSVLDGFMCGFFGGARLMTCADNDFFNIVYYACALPAIALFSLHGNRLFSLVAVIIFLLLLIILIVPLRTSFLRHVIEIGGFHAFLLYTNYNREIASRRTFVLKEQIKVQFRSKQRAQVAERQEADSKRRLMNYVFHEVRVPLNTATLAFENIEASGIMTKELSLEFTALKGSLGMMSQVLSDILDFNKMDAGQLVTVERPYHLHKAIRSMMPGAELTANSRGIKVHLDLDERVDTVARRAILAQQGLPEAEIERRFADPSIPNDGLVSGDEMRLRQILSNFITNAIKFNVPGPDAHVTVRTRLIRPTEEADDPLTLLAHDSNGSAGTEDTESDSSSSRNGQRPGSSGSSGSKPGEFYEKKSKPTKMARARRLDQIVVRFEVEDSGVSVRPQDLVKNRLFSPFIQTEIGRTQGGKGTGLGLALVRHIVALSGGRLGVISQKGVGSTFWFELAFGVGQRALREPSWPAIALGTPVAFGFQFPRMAPSPEASDIAPTPSTFEAKPTADSPIDYLTFPHTRPGNGHLRHTPDLKPPPLSHSPGGQSPMPQTPSLPTEPTSPATPTLVSQPQSPTTVQPLATMPENSVLASTPHPPRQERPTFIAIPEQSSLGPPTASTPTAYSSSSVQYPSSESTIVSPPSVSSIKPQPALPVPPSIAATLSPKPKTKIGEGLRALVVDDDLLTRRLMSRMLERLGCSVDTAEDGYAGLQILLMGKRGPSPSTAANAYGKPADFVVPDGCDVMKLENTYQVLFVDNQMPRLTGVEMAKRLRALGRKDMFVGVTGNAMTSDQNEYLSAGADIILTKPVREECLREMLVRARARANGTSVSPTDTLLPKIAGGMVLKPENGVTDPPQAPEPSHPLAPPPSTTVAVS
ncbi:hypothetical protein DL93DRAFT_2072073 [Clavulina sp. PMI_390]|nr:hypothetical protein DL93DRAFT_2072073 [Clavulina sp. PMI_390]